jgi:DEAD/DEAH box helicase domain-containing protein
MSPALLARDIQIGLKQFLVSAFEPADAFLHGLMSRFVEEEDAWFKGPYVQMGLPFSLGLSGRSFFAEFATRFPAFMHQEQAWERLASDRLALSTLIATGTGSGKTECFLYPVLSHCARARAAGEAGIKALVIYPMNALASDQARRIADLVASMPAFAGLRVGLYVGGQSVEPGRGVVMTPHSVITDHDTLRKHPPDVLLTNYKMLDYLMLRPRDRQLWAHNDPTTLRYLVVDELHTFDGAQGTDLALLLRRLRARLKIPANRLICAGTSATLGNASDTAPLRDYARQIFGVAFDAASVITESRQSVGAFLEDAPVNFMFAFRPEAAEQLESTRYATTEEAVAAWFGLFFPDEPPPVDVGDSTWRQALGALLKQHQLFVNVLKLTRGAVVSYREVTEAFARHMPSAAAAQVRQVIDALLVLVAWARRENNQPLVTLRMQLWLRELRRMVGKLSVDMQGTRLRSERDLPGQRDGIYLPMVQCIHCRTTGWLSRLVQGSSKLSTQLDEIYNTWFAARPEATRVYAAASVPRSHVDGLVKRVCVECGTLQQSQDACSACGHQELFAVFHVTAQRTVTRGNAQFTLHDKTCPACGESDSLLLLGARNATLGSQVVESSWASVFNDDKKLIAFSDSVQDAAHRAGFFGARTWLNNVRTALAHVIDELGQPVMSWSTVLTEIEKRFDTAGSVLNLPRERFVSEFIAPNMTWQHDWSVELPRHERLPAQSRLPMKVRKRILWQVFTEFTYQSQRGRTLERIGKAGLFVPLEAVEAAARELLPRFHEQYGARGLEHRTVTHWLWGMLAHMRRRGGVMHSELATYAGDGNVYAFISTAGRRDWLPKMGERTPRPVFLTQGTQRDFDKLSGPRRTTWYDRWAAATLGQQTLVDRRMAADMYGEALSMLLKHEVAIKTAHHQGDTWSLNPDRLELHTELAFIATEGSNRRLTVPRAAAHALLGMSCLDAPESRYTVLIPEAAGWWAQRYSRGSLRRVIAAEHTGLLERAAREELETRFKSKQPQPWYENLLSATPTLEMGVDIGDLSSVLLCSVPPSQASFLQRVGRAGRLDGNAVTVTLADGSSPHDLYFFAETQEMMSGEVTPPGVFLKAAEVLRRQLFAFCMDDWVAGLVSTTLLPEKTSQALDAMEQSRLDRFPYLFCDHVLKNEDRLFQEFLALLASDIDDAVRGRLLDFMQGQGERDGLRDRLIKALGELLEERRDCKRRKDELDKDKTKLQQQPQDEATKEAISTLLRERDTMLELIKEINGRDLLNTLTDAGLLPNYAFPESGVELKSVLWRKRSSDEPGQGAYVTLKTLKYERPAQSALSEFAPENRFYANQRRVEVDQVNMKLAKTEDWRFCSSCHYMQNLVLAPDTHMACPRCGDAMWADTAQRRTLLRFKQAIANSNDTEVRIDDSADDREPKFYVRQLMADFSSESIREAWQLKTDALPFGFEFITRVTFRDVNFGELAKAGDAFKVADKESVRPGFRLCKECGKVQKAPRGSGVAPEQSHSLDCPKRVSDDPANVLECLYLYREFESEALRVLVPYTKNGVDEEVVQSFMAAVQLGLKKRFGGKVDHLRMILQDEPGKDGGPRRHYVMLFDSVPGGTGYLHQLLAHDAGTLGEVLRMALQTLKECSCNQDPEKDGCYRCLYQYRLGRSMDLVSRDKARSTLDELVKALDRLERVKTISDIYINPNFDSALEARFIESLKRLGGVGTVPAVKLVQDLVNGKSGYVIEVGGTRYKIELQRNVGRDDGVALSSRPDFVIWPWNTSANRRPIAVFCDGWVYHKDTLREDARKRSALVTSGRFWVWSVTHNDVTAALKGDLNTDLESALIAMSRREGAGAPQNVPRAQEQAFTHHAVTRLLLLLATPADNEAYDPAVRQLQRNSLWLGFRMIAHNPVERIAAESFLEQWKHRLPSHARDMGQDFAPVVSKPGRSCLQFGGWPMDVAKTGMDAAIDWSAPGVLVLDDVGCASEQELAAGWRQWLHVFNTVQTLPGMWLVSASGLDAHDYKALANAVNDPQVATATLEAAWEGVIKQTLKPVHAGLIALAHSGAVPPDIGMELADEQGKVVADSELSWMGTKLVVLRADQADLAGAWQSQGWTALVLDESLDAISGADWVGVVAPLLGVNLPNKEMKS